LWSKKEKPRLFTVLRQSGAGTLFALTAGVDIKVALVESKKDAGPLRYAETQAITFKRSLMAC